MTLLEVSMPILSERIASDEESPPISVAVGSAIYPDDGESIEKLLSAADQALYGMKRPPDVSSSPQAQQPERRTRK